MQFKIEQVAIAPKQSQRAMRLLAKLGLSDWVADVVVAEGEVFGEKGENTAHLNFNYQADRNFLTSSIGQIPDQDFNQKPLELEVLDYVRGPNWIADERDNGGTVSHFGMHVTEEELAQFHDIFKAENIDIAQEVFTKSHTNAHIKDSRRYHYRIYDTRSILGVDLKFIVRRDITQ